MKLEKKFLITALIALVVAVPVSNALRHRTKLLNLEKKQNSTLQIQIKTQQKQIEELNKQIPKPEAPAPVTKIQAQQAPVATLGGCEAYRGLVSQYSWNVTIALAVMRAESGCDPNSNNNNDGHTVCLGSRGLFQIGCDSTANYDGMFDPATNVAQAFALYNNRGWSPWGAYNSGSYLRYI